MTKETTRRFSIIYIGVWWFLFQLQATWLWKMFGAHK